MDGYNDNLHKNANSKLFEYAKEMRKGPTKAEELLWEYLRNRKVRGLKFRRQHPLDKFIADFYCNEKRLVIELDGSIHDEKEQRDSDQGRTYELKELNITVIRFRNEEVTEDIKKVLERIIKITSTL